MIGESASLRAMGLHIREGGHCCESETVTYVILTQEIVFLAYRTPSCFKRSTTELKSEQLRSTSRRPLAQDSPPTKPEDPKAELR